MPLSYNGNLIVKITAQPFANLFAEDVGNRPVAFAGYVLEPLSTAPALSAQFSLEAPADHWALARAEQPALGKNPWDAAHEAAAAADYAHYVEPDILHERAVAPPATQSDGGMDGHWPPHADVSPGWHLDASYTGFSVVRQTTRGKGIIIGHLDTGYTPKHASTPRYVLSDYGYDFWDDTPGAIDPGTGGALLNTPGHGTATLALLAGNELDLTFGNHRFQGDFGGAPDAQIVPVRISPSVVHLYTSSMAKGLYHALAPNGDTSKRCDVVTISHGGLPTNAWADAVNMLYDNGVVVVAASGDCYALKVVNIATRYTVYPSAFNRVITALGATFEKKPYITDDFGQMQGCWGPDSVMEKAIAAFTPNVAWMAYDDLPSGFGMHGSGTSASTPQIAAACALWLSLYQDPTLTGWQRVEACRLALFASAANNRQDVSELGWGLLDVPAMLDAKLAKKAIVQARGGQPSHEDKVSWPILTLLFGGSQPGSARERMYETEVAQIIMSSTNPTLAQATHFADTATTLAPNDAAVVLSALAREDLSQSLRARLGL